LYTLAGTVAQDAASSIIAAMSPRLADRILAGPYDDNVPAIPHEMAALAAHNSQDGEDTR
jgi:hypothetical protein